MSEKSDILAIFNGYGEPIDIPHLTKLCLKEQVFTESEDKWIFQKAQDKVRKVLNDQDLDGMPESLVRSVVIERSPDGEITEVELRIQKTFWTMGDAKIWVKRRVAQMRNDHKKLMSFLGYAEKRWPEIPWKDLVPIDFRDEVLL